MRKDIERRIRKKHVDLQEVEAQIAHLTGQKELICAVIMELDSILKTLPKESAENVAGKELRVGTDVYRAREVLRKANEPLHVGQLLEKMGERSTKSRRSSLSSQIAAYVRNNDIFLKTAPNTFGLKNYGPMEADDLASYKPQFMQDETYDEDVLYEYNNQTEEIPF